MWQNRLIGHGNVRRGLLVTINDAGHIALTTNSSSGPLAGFAAGCGLNCNDLRHGILQLIKPAPQKSSFCEQDWLLDDTQPPSRGGSMPGWRPYRRIGGTMQAGPAGSCEAGSTPLGVQNG